MHQQNYIYTLIGEIYYSKGTINLAFNFIRTSLKRAKVLKLIKSNPAIDVVLPRIIKTKMKVWTLDQVYYFLNGIKPMRNATRFRISFSIAIFTGMLHGEILALLWKDRDFENNRIFFRQTFPRRGELQFRVKNSPLVRQI